MYVQRDGCIECGLHVTVSNGVVHIRTECQQSRLPHLSGTHPLDPARGVHNFQRNRGEHKPPSIHVHLSVLQLKLILLRLILDFLCLLGLEDNGN